MSLFRTEINPLITINTVVFDNFINLKTIFQIPPNEYIYNQNNNFNKKRFNFLSVFNKSECKNNEKTDLKSLDNFDTIKIEDLKKLQLNQSIKSMIKSYEDAYYLHQKVLSNSSEKLKKELSDNTWFELNFENWNITNLVRKYNIDGKTLFLTMVSDTKEYHDLWDEKKYNKEYKYFDYCGSYGLKNCYPLNIYKSQTKLNLRRYVDRSGITGYQNLIKLFEEKIKLPPNPNIKIEEIEESEETYNPNANSAQIKIPSMNLEKLQINYYNRNFDCLSGKKPTYSLDTNFDGKFDEFNKFLSEGKNNKTFNLDKYFKYVLRTTYDYNEDNKLDKSNLENYVLTPMNDVRLENISIVNSIIFGESNIRFSDVEKLLSLIRFCGEYCSYTLDNFIINYYSEHHLSLITDDKKINSLEFCKYSDMLECAKWLVQIMNQINPSQINHHNYHTIVSYCKFKDNVEEQNFNNLISIEKMRIREKTFEDN